MNTETLKRGVIRKSEIDQVAKELGYESAAEAAADLRALGILEEVAIDSTPFVEAMTAKPKVPEYDMLSNGEARDIARSTKRLPYAQSQINAVVKKVENRYITCKQFSFLLNGVKDFAEDDLFNELVDNIFDLHNFNAISWHYSHHRDQVYHRFRGLYPAIKGEEYVMPSNVGHMVGTTEPIPLKKTVVHKVAKQFKKKEAGFIAAASALIGFVLGALLF